MRKFLLIAALAACLPSQADARPRAFAASGAKCFDLFPTTVDGDVVTGTDLYRVVVRSAFTVTNVYAHSNTSPTTTGLTFDVNEGGSTILSTKLTVDATEPDSSTAATAAVISDTAIAANGVLSVDVDSADSGNTAAGAEVQVCGYFN
jgi:hypothetical protein